MALTTEEAWSLEQLGHTYMSRGKLDEARALFTGLTALAPQRPYAWRALGEVSRLSGDLQRAVSYLQHALKLDQHDAPTRLTLGTLLLKLNQPQQAREVLGPFNRKPSAQDDAVVLRGRALLQRRFR